MTECFVPVSGKGVFGIGSGLTQPTPRLTHNLKPEHLRGSQFKAGGPLQKGDGPRDIVEDTVSMETENNIDINTATEKPNSLRLALRSLSPFVTQPYTHFSKGVI